jgi:hypothetical protein
VTTAPLRRRRLWPREEAQENPLRLVQQRGGSLRERTELGPAVGDTDQCERQVQLQGDRVGRLAPARVGVTRVVRADQDAGRPRTTSPAQRVATKCARSRAGSAMAARSQSSIRNPPAARRLWGAASPWVGTRRRSGAGRSIATMWRSAATRSVAGPKGVASRSAALRVIDRSIARASRRRGRPQRLLCRSASRAPTLGSHGCRAAALLPGSGSPGTCRQTTAAQSARWRTGSASPGGDRRAPKEECHNAIVMSYARAAVSALGYTFATRSPRVVLHLVTGRSACRPRVTGSPLHRMPALASACARSVSSSRAAGRGSADECTEARRPVRPVVPFLGQHS